MARDKQVGERCQHLHFASDLVAPARSHCGIGKSMPRSRELLKAEMLLDHSEQMLNLGAEVRLG